MGRQLSGKSAIVTGSTSGIGRGIAECFAREGANVVLNGLGDAATIAALRAGLEKEHGVRALYHGADMTRPAEITAMVAEAAKAFGRVDIIVNNAGIQHGAPVDEFPPEKWDAILAVNLSSAFHATRAALPGMKKAKWGRVINIASAHGLVASPFKSAYVAAKHGLVGFTKSLARELVRSGVLVNAIAPVITETGPNERKVTFKIDEGAKIRIGEIRFEGQPLAGVSVAERVRRGIAPVLEARRLFGVDRVMYSDELKKVVGRRRVALPRCGPGGLERRQLGPGPIVLRVGGELGFRLLERRQPPLLLELVLRQFLQRDPAKWPEFRKRHLAELQAQPAE